MTEDKMSGIRQAKEQQSLEKRRAVEEAIAYLKKQNEPVTFKAIAKMAKVSRQYLYNNFKKDISEFRSSDRSSKETIDGVVVPVRTPEEARHVEALLRNKIDRLKKELSDVRHENARLKNLLEKERGKSEHFRKNWIAASTK